MSTLLLACATCSSNTEAGGQAASWSILFLLGVILPLLGLVAVVMFRIIRAGERALDPELCDQPYPTSSSS
jgi:hypothetical protein